MAGCYERPCGRSSGIPDPDRPSGRGSRQFPLRGIKDTPPYLHDGRLLTLDDTVEYFNLVLGTKLTDHEKKDLVAFLLAL